MDCIFLREVKVELLIGIYEWERRVPQTIQIDLDIALPHSNACHSDQVEDTIDYGSVAERVRQTLAENHFNLVEAAAEHVAQLLLGEFGSPWVRVSITKLGMIRGVRHVGIAIERGIRS